MPRNNEQGAPAAARPARYRAGCQPAGSLCLLTLLSLVVGAATGLTAAYFRLALEQADVLRDRLIDWGHSQSWIGFAAVTGACAVATAIAAWMVRRWVPQASGSGIPHVEAVLHGTVPPAP